MNKYFRKIKRMADIIRMRTDIQRGVPVRFKFRGKVYYLNADGSAIYHIQNSTNKIAKMTDLISPDTRMIFDVGGNCGLFSAFAEASCPDASIHCFEPSISLLPIIHKNVSKARVQVHNVAVGDTNGQMKLYINPESEQTNSLNRDAVELFTKAERIETRIVDCITLDSFVADNNINKIDVLKVDVQGFEGQVFRGCKKMLPNVDMLIVESTWMDIESIIELIPFALHYGFNFASVLNPVHLGADILFSRQEVNSPDIIMVFAISDKLLSRTWT